MKLPRQHAQKFFAAFMALCMSCLMSALITWINVGSAAFPMPWLKNWGLAFIIALPAILVLAPIGQRLVAHLTE